MGRHSRADATFVGIPRALVATKNGAGGEERGEHGKRSPFTMRTRAAWIQAGEGERTRQHGGELVSTACRRGGRTNPGWKGLLRPIADERSHQRLPGALDTVALPSREGRRLSPRATSRPPSLRPTRKRTLRGGTAKPIEGGGERHLIPNDRTFPPRPGASLHQQVETGAGRVAAILSLGVSKPVPRYDMANVLQTI